MTALRSKDIDETPTLPIIHPLLWRRKIHRPAANAMHKLSSGASHRVVSQQRQWTD